ncbi:hypothetical protein LTR62_002017 [Meristemomyces frigidus]|uniref:Kynurenine formamidase n=1 Tax=Meristemomyces frigidus TaxID=1508187 RepID=A0AAN7TMM8_9PEZI|nr:hypothetical protein LTR62_002017 [Meristemomyces frigidus]
MTRSLPTNGTSSDYPQVQNDVPYSEESSLNTLDICIPRLNNPNHDPLWIVFIHGGAWQDPAISASSFRKTQDLLLDSSEIKSIAGLASLNYRLSPYPAHETDPSNPADPARNAKHPDHINDVLTAILYLQERYLFQDRYILVGHSVGATLAFQVAMKRYWGVQYESTYALELNVEPPLAILGVEGIYDLPALVKYHRKEPVYEGFVSNANGSDSAVWKAVSPVEGLYEQSWPDGRLVVIAHSHGDELVEWEQAELMVAALEGQGWDDKSDARHLKVLEMTGKHDQVWEEGGELARAIVTTLQGIQAMA